MTTINYGKVVDTGGNPVVRIVVAAVVLVLLMILVFSSVTTVRTGHVAVLTLFGRVTGDVLPEGIHLINPLKSVREVSIQTQQVKETASVPSSEGLVVGLDTSLIFHLDPRKAADVIQNIQPPYEETLVEPTLRSTIRSVTAAHTANALYTSAREQVAGQIQIELEKELAPRGIVVEKILLRDIQLPATLRASIELKQQAEQESLAMSFRLQKEKQEADRKRIEAEGIRDFQRTVAQGLTDQLLTWKGVEATERLANSQNTKIVIVGNSKNGLPLILGQ
ncbi:MAG: prohibitin family protein [Acidobacteriota bacterium]|nr:prohibitin family protein [Acidobacteriota bacterium]